MVCVEGWDYAHIYSIHTDKAEAESVCRKLNHQFSGAYITGQTRMMLDMPEPNEGETFWHVWEGGFGATEVMPLTEWRADEGFENDVDYGAVLQREIADGEVVSARTREEAERLFATKEPQP